MEGSVIPADVENLILEYLKRFQTGQDRIERTLQEHTQRLGRLESSVAGLRHDISDLHGDWAALSVRMDRLTDRVERIERRLELTA